MAYDGRTLTYHLNRLADTLTDGIPQYDAQGAANIWAGTAGLDLHGALNVKAGTSGLGVGRTLNLIAGTDNADPLSAIADYTDVHPYFAAQTADTPLAQWRMDETSGTTMVDSSGNGHDGTYAGGLAIGSTVGAFTAPHFVNDWAKHAVVTNGAWMNGVNSAITMEGLYYADTFTSYATLFGVDSMGQSPRRMALRWDTGAGGLNACLSTSSNDYTTGGLGPAGVTGAWYHAAAVYSQSAGKLRGYINGTKVIEITAAGTLTSATTSLFVGRTGYTVSSYGAWDGYLCGLAWYETALSDARLLAHAQAAGLA